MLFRSLVCFPVTIGKGEAGIEAGVEIEDKLGKIVNVGVNVAVLARPELTGTFGVGLLGKNFSSLAVEPEACLELKVKGDFESKAFSKTFWNKEPLIAVGTFPLIASETKKWGVGVCKDDDNSTGNGKGYTKISATGAKLPNSAIKWDCVLDNETG